MKIVRHNGFQPDKTTGWDIVRYVLIGLVGLLFLWTLLPIFAGIFHAGMAGGLVLLGGLLAVLLCWKRVKKWVRRSTAGKIAMGAAAVFLTVTMVCSGILSVQMILAAGDSPEEGETGTVVILGAKVGSLSLQRRMEAGLRYLQEHPDAVCVASGGQGENEPHSEAEAIRDYLVSRGIEEQRILVENASTNTEENLQNTKRIVEQNGLSQHLIVVTDDYHQLRAKINAQRLGMTVSAYSCRPQFFIWLSYWERELLALAYTICFEG